MSPGAEPRADAGSGPWLENVPVRCPACRREHAYAPPVLSVRVRRAVVAPLRRGAPAEPVTHRTWHDDWVTVRCGACGRRDHWPHPELGCACGTVLRIPVEGDPAPSHDASPDSAVPGDVTWPGPALRHGGRSGSGRCDATGARPHPAAAHGPRPAPRVPAGRHPDRAGRGDRRRALPALAGLPRRPPRRPAALVRDRPRGPRHRRPGRPRRAARHAARRGVPVADRP